MSIAIGGTSHYAYTLTEPVTTVPMTISCWAKIVDLINTHVVVAIDTPNSSGYNILGTLDFCGACTSPADVPRAYSYDGGFGIANASTSYTIGSWVHICGVFTSTTSRSIFYNGSNKGTNTTSVSATPSELIIGRRRRNSAQGPCQNGDYIAEVAVWSSALSDADVALLAGGQSPLETDAANLVAYWPLTTVSTNTDSKGSNDLTESTTLTYSSDHPTITPPTGPMSITATLSGEGGISFGPLTVIRHLGATTLSGLGGIIPTATITNINLLGHLVPPKVTLPMPGWNASAKAGSANNWVVTPKGILAPNSGSRTQVDPIPAAEDKHQGSGVLKGAGHLWFDMAHILPRLVQDMGNLITEQTINCELYNADRQSPITVSSITDNLGTGFTVTGVPAVPFNIASQEGLPFTIKVLATGDLIIDGDYTFTLSTGETYTVYIIGSRIVLLPMRPEAPLREHLIWETKILPAIDTSEQRIANRATPRGMFEFELKEDRKWAEMILFDRQSKLLAVPAWHEPSFLTSAGAEDDLTINVDTTAYGNFYVGGYAVVRHDSYTFDALKIESMTATTLTFESGLSQAYAEGTEVMPLMIAYAEATTPMVKAVYNDQTIEVKLHVHATPNDIADASAFSEYNSKPFMDGPNFLGDGQLQEALRTKVYVLDNHSGDRSQFAQWIRSLRNSQKGFKTNSRQELWELRQLLHFLKGQQVSFYIPTFSKDLMPNDTLVVSNSTLTMDNIGYATNAQERWPKKVFRIHLKNGTILTRTIQSSTQISASEEQLTVDTVWPYNIEPEDIERIEFIEKIRFNTDDIMIIHQNACGWATCVVPTVEVTDDDV